MFSLYILPFGAIWEDIQHLDTVLGVMIFHNSYPEGQSSTFPEYNFY